MIRVLFVCLGNICRSPMAEAVFLHLVKEAGLSHTISADSAGTAGYHIGDLPHHGTREVLAKRGVTYDGRARQVTRQDLDDFDYIVAMDNANLRDLHQLAGRHHPAIVHLLSYAPATGLRDVPDPYYTGAFDQTYELVSAGAAGLLAKIRADHKL